MVISSGMMKCSKSMNVATMKSAAMIQYGSARTHAWAGQPGAPHAHTFHHTARKSSPVSNSTPK